MRCETATWWLLHLWYLSIDQKRDCLVVGGTTTNSLHIFLRGDAVVRVVVSLRASSSSSNVSSRAVDRLIIATPKVSKYLREKNDYAFPSTGAKTSVTGWVEIVV